MLADVAPSQLANRLSLEADEASLRTAVSRAYYGVFHIARRLVMGFGVDLPRHNEHKHSRIQQCLINRVILAMAV
jgi:uncharacterized protein (UPF0332 family)